MADPSPAADPAGHAERQRPLNVLLVVIDQLRADALGCMGSPCAHTPHIDRLARRGVLFTRHYVQGSPCGPSRASLLTGQYVMNHRVISNETPTGAHLKTLPMMVREAGLEPAMVGYTTTVADPRALPSGDPRRGRPALSADWHVVRDFEDAREHYLAWLSGRGHAVPPRYEDLFRPGLLEPDAIRYPPAPLPATDTDTAWCVDGALDYLRRRMGRPWFMHLGLFRPHPPFMATSPYDEWIDPARVPVPRRLGSVAEQSSVHPLVALLLDSQRAANSVTGLDRRASELEVPELMRIRLAYHGLLAEVDHHLGRVFDWLESSGEAARTLIVLTSDHGEQLGDRHMLGKRGFFPESYHVPCIVVDPSPAADDRRGIRDDRFTENVDLLPTILDWLGRPAPSQCDGRSLLPLVRSAPVQGWRTRVFWEYDFRDAASGRAPERRGLSPQQCALAATCDDTHACVQFAGLPPLLFDCRVDPLWACNLATEPAARDLLHAHTQALLQWRICSAERTLHG